MRLTRRERITDLRELYGAAWVESASEMMRRMTPEQEARLGHLQSEQAFLLERGKPSPRLDPALASDEGERSVAYALANRRLMRRALGPARSGPRGRG